MAIANLRRVPWLRDLPARELKRILAIARTLDFSAGSSIFDKADAAQHMFIVLAGRVKIYSRSGTRKNKIFAYLGPGDFFGEMAVLEDMGRSASAEAVEPSRLFILHKRDFKQLLLSDAQLTYNLLKAVSARLRRADEEIESLLFRNVLGRVAKTLCDLGRRFGKKSPKGLLLAQRFTQQELADLVGTSREPLARALASLRRAELVNTDHGNLYIRNWKRLEALVQAAPAD